MTTPQQQNTPAAPSADDFLMGGGGAPSAKFPAFGTVVGGRITEKPTVEQQRDISTGEKKFWKDGNQMMQLVVTVQTDQRDPEIDEDDGRRRLFVKSHMKSAIADAVRATGAKGLEVGGILTVTYTGDGAVTQRGFNAPKLYTATYTPAATVALHTPDPGTAQQQQYQAPVAPQYVAPAPQPQYAAAVAPAAVPQLTPEQYAAAMANPATAALIQQQAVAQPATGGVPPF